MMIGVKILFDFIGYFAGRYFRKQEILESAKGQWYDRKDLTKEELYGEVAKEEPAGKEEGEVGQATPRSTPR